MTAKDTAQSIIAATPAQAVTPSAATPTDLADAYALSIDTTSERTRQTYRRGALAYLTWLDDRGMTPKQATEADVIAYKRELLAAGKSAATVNAYLTGVRGLYKWLQARRVCADVASNVKGAKRGNCTVKAALTADEARRLEAVHSGNTLADKRDHAMLTLMLRRGLRTIEVARANVGDLHRVGQHVLLYVQGKGHDSADDYVIITGKTYDALADYLAARGPVEPDAPLFAATGNRNAGGRMTTRSISRIAKAALTSIGTAGAEYSAHALRHSCVTLALEAGATVQDVQQLARHTNIETTMIYVHRRDRLKAKTESALDDLLAS